MLSAYERLSNMNLKRFHSLVTAIVAFATMSTFVAFGQTGQPFPELEGELLEGGTIVLPTSNSRPVVIGMAYSKQAEDDLKTWYQPMYDTFVLKRGIFDHMYNNDLYMIPMFTGAKKVAYEAAMKKMREENRPDLFPHIIFYKGSLEPFASVLRMSDKKMPYLFVIDENGTVVYATSGQFTEKKKQAIEAALEALMD